MNKKAIDFVGKRKIFFTISLILIVSIIISSFFFLKVAIEFKGGTIVSYSYDGDINTKEAKSTIEKIVNSQVNLQVGDSFNSDKKILSISFVSDEGLTGDAQYEMTTELKKIYPDNGLELYDSNDVSPSSGKTFFYKCLAAVVFASIVLIIYIALRFKKISGWSAGVFAVVALLHDSIMVLGTFIVCGFSISANFMAVALTILGYSINDTIVIYDRIRENRTIYPRMSVRELVNLSTTQSLSRSINTTISTILAMAVVSIVAVIMGVDSILSFSFPLIIGMISGTYSTLCIASPLWVWWIELKEKKHADNSGKRHKPTKA